MEQAYSIWAPVIVSHLTAPRKFGEQREFDVDQIYKSLEDLKVKVKASEVSPQGQNVETKLILDILCLVEDMTGRMQLIKKEEIVKDRVPVEEFENAVDREKEIQFVMDIINVNFEGEISGREIRVAFFIDYMLMATREQEIHISMDTSSELETDSLNKAFIKLKTQLVEMEKENRELRKKLFLYVRDVSSLKRGIQKVENRNAILNKEVRYYRELNDGLRQKLDEKESRIYRYQNYANYQNDNHDVLEADEINGLGSRIKRMFLNSL